MKREEFCDYQEKTFDAFCKRVIHNTGLNEKRKAAVRERRETSLLEFPEDELIVPPFEIGDHSESYHYDFLVCGMVVSVSGYSLTTALKLLPSSLRDILLLYYYCDYNMTQIAALLNLPLSTVDYRHKRALRLLRQQMEDDRRE